MLGGARRKVPGAGPAPRLCSASLIPLCSWPRELWATDRTYEAFPAGLFSSWDSCYGKTLQQAFLHPGRCFPLGFIAWGGSRHRRVWVKGIAESSFGSSRMVPCWVVLLAALCDGGLGGLWEGDPIPAPQQCCDPSAASGPGQCCPVHMALQTEKHFRLQELPHGVCGCHVCPPASGPSSIQHILAAGKPLCSYKRHVWQGDQRNHCH